MVGAEAREILQVAANPLLGRPTASLFEDLRFIVVLGNLGKGFQLGEGLRVELRRFQRREAQAIDADVVLQAAGIRSLEHRRIRWRRWRPDG